LTRENVADLTSHFAFSSEDEEDQWICWDFQDLRIQITHYTIRSDKLKSWELMGSMDGTNWEGIDTKTNAHFIGGEFVTAVDKKSKPWRLILLMQRDRNWIRHHFLALPAVEFFGTLFENTDS
jgi:hypothetical protein